MSESISINVKASNDKKYVIAINSSETVLDFKTKIALNCDTPADRMRLIYSGRVLKDPEPISTYNIAEGHTVHMVRGALTFTTTASTTATNTPTSTAASPSSSPSRNTTTSPQSVTPGTNEDLLNQNDARAEQCSHKSDIKYFYCAFPSTYYCIPLTVLNKQ